VWTRAAVTQQRHTSKQGAAHAVAVIATGSDAGSDLAHPLEPSSPVGMRQSAEGEVHWFIDLAAAEQMRRATAQLWSSASSAMSG
jgi:hypothetical protein